MKKMLLIMTAVCLLLAGCQNAKNSANAPAEETDKANTEVVADQTDSAEQKEEAKQEEPAVVAAAFHSFEFFPWSFPSCMLSSVVGQG